MEKPAQGEGDSEYLEKTLELKDYLRKRELHTKIFGVAFDTRLGAERSLNASGADGKAVQFKRKEQNPLT